MIKQNPNLLQVTRPRSLNFRVFSRYTGIDLRGAGQSKEQVSVDLAYFRAELKLFFCVILSILKQEKVISAENEICLGF